jgi:hypothetical protein
MHDPTKEKLRQGRRLLRALLPVARAKLKEYKTAEVKEFSALGRAQMPFVTENNFDALLIYPAPHGGWHVDLKLKRVPPGVANILGTPVEKPVPTRELADEVAIDMLATALCLSEQQKAAPRESKAAFLLHGWEIPIHPDILAVLAYAGYGETTEERRAMAAARIGELLTELCGREPFSAALFQSWSKDDQARLMSVIHMAAYHHILRYPPRQDASPSGHHPHETR